MPTVSSKFRNAKRGETMTKAKVYERPFVPVDLSKRAAALFPLPAMIEQLRNEESFRDSNRNALTLVHQDGLTAVLTVAVEGAQCADHSAPEATFAVCLSGELEVRAGTGGAVIAIPPGEAAILAPHVEHRFVAVTDCAYLLVMGGEPAEA
jgi:quercetin dioxygenase-like cupin family protein